MDFWSRLIGGTSRQKQQTSPQKNTAQQRLNRYKSTYNSVLQLCSRPQQLTIPGPAIEQLHGGLQKLSAILREEVRAPAPHSCLAFSAQSQIYSVIARAASVCKNEKVISETVSIFGLLIDSEAEGFLTYRTFARALMRFAMKILDNGPVFVSQDTEAQLVEIMFAVAAKIRLDSDILPIWFSGNIQTEFEGEAGAEKRNFVGITQKDDFPLCYMFIDRVHHEGRIGDFARTGLLYVFEAASRSKELESWIVASDLPTLMASGLGALYSQLSRELSLRQDPDKLPLLLALSDYTEMHRDTNAESAFSESHAAHVATFLSDLTFWQDILDHCQSADVKQTLLDHFQILFLQQLLYPSLLQSSDTDGGSSVAVLTYLTNMLQTLSYPDLIEMMLNYLLAVQEKPVLSSRPSSPRVIRRKSVLEDMTSTRSEEDKLEPMLFNLVDLIQTGLSSRNPQTTFAALKLYVAISTRHRSFAFGTLIRVNKYRDLENKRTVGALNAEMENLLGLASTIGGSHRLDEAYNGACLDIQGNLELQGIQLEEMVAAMKANILQGEIPMSLGAQYLLDTRDPCFGAMVNLIENFLTNSVDTNLALTEALLGIATSRDVRLDGWLVLFPVDYRYNAAGQDDNSTRDLGHAIFMDDEERAKLDSVRKMQRRPDWNRSSESTLLAALRLLETQVDLLRKSYVHFDQMLLKRKTILLGHDKAADDPFEDSQTRPLSPVAPRQISHIRQGSITSSRAASPARSINANRGRPVVERSPTKSPTMQRSPVSSFGSRRRRSLISPSRVTTSVFRPPPPESSLSPPLRGFSIDETALRTDNEAETLSTKVRFPLGDFPNGLHHGGPNIEGHENEIREVSLSHILTNVVVLQNFIIELVVVMQLRASVFEEVRFC